MAVHWLRFVQHNNLRDNRPQQESGAEWQSLRHDTLEGVSKLHKQWFRWLEP